MDQISGTTPTDAAAQGPEDSQPEAPGTEQSPVEQSGFRSRGRARRRARFLRRARELAYRDLGGLVFNLHRFGQRNDALVLAKLDTLSRIDGELRTIETALQERRPVTVLREAGITACPRCAAIHGSEDRFCPNCGLPMSRHADLPIAGAPAGAGEGVGAPPRPQPSQAPAAAPGPPAQAAPVQAAPAPAAVPASPSPGAAAAPTPPQAPAGGRAPTPPPTRTMPQTGAAQGAGRAAPEESTEILHPQAPGS